MEKRIEIKVYYEDTDCLGVVYHANYLRFLERGRTDFIDSLGKSVVEWNREGYNFAVYQIEIKFKNAARLGDICRVVTDMAEGGSEYRKKIGQRIELNGKVITEAVVDLVCLDTNLELREFPKGLFP
ncbi:MAG: YbgC/FadM family acyl-CoA thioesterase [Spirochaetota bacterium]|nr:YbgC/FadM family acyl-CoA thioesterase [Spirochaetota bacterium]